MESEEVAAKQENGAKRKSQFQLESLESFYLENKYPSQDAMENYAFSLKLTYKQVRSWFVERRRKEKREKELVCSSGKTVSGNGESQPPDGIMARRSRNETHKQSTMGQRGLKTQNGKLNQSKKNSKSVHAKGLQMKKSIVGMNCKQKTQLFQLQDLLTPDYILRRVFRKDGPPLGVEFDFLPMGSFGNRSGPGTLSTSQDNQRVPKRRKIAESTTLGSLTQKTKSAPVMKYGIGKGMMTVWRATNPDAQSSPTGVDFINRGTSALCSKSTFSVYKPSCQELKKPQYRSIAQKQRRLGNKLQDKRKPPMKKRKVECNKMENQKELHKAECKLAIEGLGYQGQSDALMVLVDDEELELRELQIGPNPLKCSHQSINGTHGCSLCKDLLARFPPKSVKMKQPFCKRPWDSSPDIVKKLFKVFRFLYTHAVAVDIFPFTLDEFAQAFQDKDSLLLGKIHVALLKLLLSDVEREFCSGFLPRAVKDCRFLGFLHFIREEGFDVKFWNKALNALTWTEILRMVLVAAGFGAKRTTLQRAILSKERSLMTKYGLCSGTLKGELFKILAEQGSNGLKISELARSFQIVELNITSQTEALENLICSMLSSDITLFEKISPCTYRLRVHTLSSKGTGNQSDTEESGSVDDDSEESSCNSHSDDSDESELDSECDRRIVSYKAHRKQKSNKLIEHTEIDESHSGEVWVLGLMEGEYSDLSIEEKLNALVALVHLASAGSSIRAEHTVRNTSESTLDIHHGGSGAKLKRLSASQHISSKPFQGHVGYMQGNQRRDALMESLDAFRRGQSFGKVGGCHKTNGSKSKGEKTIDESGSYIHSMQSMYLGSDRRYNSYWLFLGPCDGKDPGHRRVYFESSEDGHWEVIDTEQALCALLSNLDTRGARESQLFASLEKREAFLCQAMTNNRETINGSRQLTRSYQSDMDISSGVGSSPVSDIDNNGTPTEDVNISLTSSGAIALEPVRNGEDKREKWDRLQAFDSWIWNSFYSNLNSAKYSKRSYMESLARCASCHDLYWRDEKHCKTCHTTFELDFDMEERYAIHIATCREKEDGDIFPRHKVLSSQLQSLKAALPAIEAAMPKGALVGSWTMSVHKLWVKRLRRASSLPEFLQILNDFVGAINEDWLCHFNIPLGPNTALDEIVTFFPTIPQTTSAVGLWLVKLDALLAPYLESVQSEEPPESNPQTRSTRRLA